MSQAPTLQEIADMPWSAGREALNKHYGPALPEMGEGETRTFRVLCSYSYRSDDSKVYEVEARSGEQAEEEAEVAFNNDGDLPPDAEAHSFSVLK